MSEEETALTKSNPRTREIKIADLDITLTLRPLPVSIAREMSKTVQNVAEEIQKIGRSAMMIRSVQQKYLTDFTENKMSIDEFVLKTSELAEKQKEHQPPDLDWMSATAIMDSFMVLLRFHGKQFTKETVEGKMTISDIVEIIEDQIALNSKHDFLLVPVRMIVSLVKKSAEDAHENAEKMTLPQTT